MKEIIVYSADWCSGCTVLKTALGRKGIPFSVVNVDELTSEELSDLKVRQIPVAKLLKDSEVVKTVVGYSIVHLEDICKFMEEA